MAHLVSTTGTDGVSLLLVIALIGAGAALFGHLVVRSNAKLQAAIGEKTARLANEQSRDNAKLSAKLAANVKLAEMRQLWINELRNEMTRFFSLCNQRRDESGMSSARKVHESGTKIKLSMNPEDIDYKELRDAMFAIYSAVPPTTTAEDLDDQYLAVCQRILKREWDVLKKEISDAATVDFRSEAQPDTHAVPWYKRVEN